jgi:hypothetical protein
MQIVVTLINVCRFDVSGAGRRNLSSGWNPRLHLLKTPVCSSMRRYPPAHQPLRFRLDCTDNKTLAEAIGWLDGHWR